MKKWKPKIRNSIEGFTNPINVGKGKRKVMAYEQERWGDSSKHVGKKEKEREIYFHELLMKTIDEILITVMRETHLFSYIFS